MSDTPRTEAALKASRNQFDALQKLTSEAAKLERENASLRAVAMKLIENNGGSVLQLEEQMERDSVDDYIMIKLQDFEALRAAIDSARKENNS
jgi:regulator of replication initiation timing